MDIDMRLYAGVSALGAAIGVFTGVFALQYGIEGTAALAAVYAVVSAVSFLVSGTLWRHYTAMRALEIDAMLQAQEEERLAALADRDAEHREAGRRAQYRREIAQRDLDRSRRGLPPAEDNPSWEEWCAVRFPKPRHSAEDE